MPLAGSPPIPLLVIWGATAVGKTDLAITLAQRLAGEIIGADSRQIYRHMDIGTAKPTLDQRASAPHHLIDFANPDEDVSLSTYQRHANAAIHDIDARGELPMLVGGTGQYITALLEGWTPPGVPPDPEKRAALAAEADAQGISALYARLRALDPDAADLIDANNLRRIIRALEVIDATGKLFSAQRMKLPPPYRVRVIGLALDRDALRERADRRLDQMIADGFIDEVRTLLDSGYDRSLPAMSAVGYGQIAAYLLDGVPLETALYNARIATHRFIRRQLAWFRGHDHGVLWHNRETLDVERLIIETAHWLESG
ncbi:MAG: tRNA (adenosine(37)-N6)-dimethylallyltransferase MiaA [Chloroflexota bacterium]|nr:tRNA (adenosine(37)-N6)-dimethylallyltransferase MiaA [Chloroflexota bacterium]